VRTVVRKRGSGAFRPQKIAVDSGFGVDFVP
jgi:hypothetical protein